ncbi:hypothetical protein [Actomonas aquatica]|uniref:ABC transporter permease n=1 Tax=Actomonas aquatica TaxID=2866162 RepID=A0ABZ1C683_9BACT|nr:hypothetical protein [Opitutus sp. WL0086]WRQ85815.1 hypothetical protein K1X11_013465 [Opitutus sp. WL0086]
MSASTTSSSDPFAPRVTPRLAPALGGVWRLTWRRVFAPGRAITPAVMLALIGLVTYRFASHADPLAWVEWVNQFLLIVVVPVLAFLGGAGAIREGLKPGAVDYLSTRPVPRSAYVLFCYLAQTACGLIGVLFFIGFLAAIGLAGGNPTVMAELPRQLIVGPAAVIAFTALGFGMGSLTNRYMILGLVYAGLIEAALGSIPIQINKLSLLRHLRVVVDGSGLEPFALDADSLAALGLLALVTMGLVGLAMAVYARMEFLGAKEKDA